MHLNLSECGLGHGELISVLQQNMTWQCCAGQVAVREQKARPALELVIQQIQRVMEQSCRVIQEQVCCALCGLAYPLKRHCSHVGFCSFQAHSFRNSIRYMQELRDTTGDTLSVGYRLSLPNRASSIQTLLWQTKKTRFRAGVRPTLVGPATLSLGCCMRARSGAF
jgi:hypothetical protein